MKVPNRGHSSCYHSIPMSWRAAVDALGFDDVVAVVAAAAAVVAVVVAAAAVALAAVVPAVAAELAYRAVAANLGRQTRWLDRHKW